ncbi:MAG: ATP-binding cassette domain-containing protein, partial [Nanobdellota archaeon]
LAWQEPTRFEGLQVKTFLDVSIKDKNLSSSKRETLIRNSLKTVGLEPDNYIDRALDDTLSGGERKRIELSSILLAKPKIAILDEPDSGIDIEALNHILSAVSELSKQGTTVLLITHSLKILKESEHAFLICDGKLLKKGTVQEMVPVYRQNCKNCTHKNKPQSEVIL